MNTIEVDGDAYPHDGERQEAATPPLDQSALKARVDEILNRQPAVGLAVGVVRGGSLESFYGHGLADIASGTPVTEDTVFRIGSITKIFGCGSPEELARSLLPPP